MLLRKVMMVVVSAGLMGAVSAKGEVSAQILRVERAAESSSFSRNPVNAVQGRYMPKFFSATEEVTETFEVEWEGSGLGPGAFVVFEYNVAGKEYELEHYYENPVKEKHLEHFNLAQVKVGGDKTIQAWRVRIVFQGKVVAEKKSGSWSS